MKEWQEFRSLLKAFIREVKPAQKFDGKGEYNKGWNEGLKTFSKAANAWFIKKDKEN